MIGKVTGVRGRCGAAPARTLARAKVKILGVEEREFRNALATTRASRPALLMERWYGAFVGTFSRVLEEERAARLPEEPVAINLLV